MAKLLPTPIGQLKLAYDTVVIGSGAGGATMAALLAAGGREVLVVEEGTYLPQSKLEPFSVAEMQTQYRRQGMTVALGKVPINYVEGCCVGGSTEINSGLYHRPPPDVLTRWHQQYRLSKLSTAAVSKWAQTIEQDLSITTMPAAPQPNSVQLANGATELGFSCREIPRWHRYADNFTSKKPGGVRQSMSEVYLPRVLAAGGSIVAGCAVVRLRHSGASWELHIRTKHTEPHAFVLRAKHVIVAGGAVRTPALLRRSRLRQGIGNSLRMHVFVRVIAEFADKVNGDDAGIGPHQIDEFAPRLRLGCAVATPSHLALALAQAGQHAWLADLEEKWPYRTAYYASIGGGIGTVRTLGNEDVVFYRLSRDDYYALADGLRLLAKTLFAAGAKQIVPIIKQAPVLTNAQDLWQLPRPLTASRAILSSVHLLGSCPLGSATVGDFGQVHGHANLRVCDASMLCDSPNVNPQGTIMLLAHRNASAILAGK